MLFTYIPGSKNPSWPKFWMVGEKMHQLYFIWLSENSLIRVEILLPYHIPLKNQSFNLVKAHYWKSNYDCQLFLGLFWMFWSLFHSLLPILIFQIFILQRKLIWTVLLLKTVNDWEKLFGRQFIVHNTTYNPLAQAVNLRCVTFN